MHEFLLTSLTLVFFIGNVLSLGVPIIFMERLEKRFHGGLAAVICGLFYLIMFACGIYMLTLIAPSLITLKEELYVTLMMAMLLVWQFLPLIIDMPFRKKD